MNTQRLIRATAQYIYAAVRVILEQALRQHRRCMAADAYVRILTSDPLLDLPAAIEEHICAVVGRDASLASPPPPPFDPRIDLIRARVCLLLRNSIHTAVAGAMLDLGGRKAGSERRHALACDVSARTVGHVTRLIQDTAECMLGEIEHRCRTE